nr:Sir2 family NAD-dependent protein deacetylase [Parafrankia sp. EUN1f]
MTTTTGPDVRPARPTLGDMAFASLRDLVAAGGVAVLTGAGISTGSGIPDYRGPNGSLRRHTPMTYQQFTGDAESRRRYWARSHVGWRHVALARPNPGHHAVAALEAAGLVDGVITQNVDGLHSAAGSRRVIDLHGSLARVRCRGCGVLSDRADLDRRLRLSNPGFDTRAVEGPPLGAEVNPDGDATLAEAEIDGFAVVGCVDCDGDLEPDVVFFGATVPPARLTAAVDLLARSRALLVLGSSLAVMSGYRFVLRAGELGIPVGIVNQGPTRGDARAAFTLDAQLSTVLPRLATELAGAAAR